MTGDDRTGQLAKRIVDSDRELSGSLSSSACFILLLADYGQLWISFSDLTFGTRMRMRKSFQIGLILLIFCAFGVSLPHFLRSPSYKGKPVGFWIRSLTNDANPGEAGKALQEIGIPALPYLVDALENEDRPSVKLWARLWNNSPEVARKFMREPFPWESIHRPLSDAIGRIGLRHRFSDGVGDMPPTPEFDRPVRALARGLSDPNPRKRIDCAQALGEIGPNAIVALPELVAMFKRGDSTEQIMVCQAFGTIGSRTIARDCIGPLLDGLNSQDPHVIRSAAYALGAIGPQATNAVLTLVKLIVNGDEDVRSSAVRGLARIGNLPDDIRPQLIPLLNETNARTRAGAAVALLRLNPDEELASSVVEDYLSPEKPTILRTSTVYLMMGSKALLEKFLPDIRKLENDPDMYVANFARKALKSINTDAAASKVSAK